MPQRWTLVSPLESYDVEDSRRQIPTWLFCAWIVWILGAVPLYEELFFRRILMLSFEAHWGRIAAVSLQAALFGAMHGKGNFIIQSIAALVIGTMYYATGRLRWCIVMHSALNLATLTLSV